MLDQNETDSGVKRVENGETVSKGEKDIVKSVYEQIFANTTESDNEAVVGVLCDWAPTPYRAGKHRGVLVAKLLAIKQDQIEENSERKLVPYFQEHLFNYLHDNASKLKEKTTPFNNLIILFGELIRHDIFSHSYYVQALISRGEVTTSNNNAEHNRHHAFLKHIPMPYSLTPYFSAKNEDDHDEQKGERNQRAISLYGMGSNRRDAKKKRKSLVSNLYALFSDQSDENSNLNSSEYVKMFRKMSYYDKWVIGFFLAKKFLMPISKKVKDNNKHKEIQSQADVKLSVEKNKK